MLEQVDTPTEGKWGTAASLVVLQLWVYDSAQILLLGAELTWGYAARHGSLRQESLLPAANLKEGISMMARFSFSAAGTISMHVPQPSPNVVPLPPSPHPVPPQPPVPPEIIDPVPPGGNEPVYDPVEPNPQAPLQ